jgi:hypothetical protein
MSSNMEEDDDILVKYYFICHGIHTLWNTAPECISPVYRRYLSLTKTEKKFVQNMYVKNKQKVSSIIKNFKN